MKKIIMLILCAAAAVSLASCKGEEKAQTASAEEPKKTEEQTQKIADNKSAEGVINNYYAAYEYCDAAYQMATFAPEYKEYVIAQYGYADEEEMESRLGEILADICASYEQSFGAGYIIVPSIEKEEKLSEAELKALKAELKESYGKDFSVEEAKNVTVKVFVSAMDEGEAVTASSAVGSSEETLCLGKNANGEWYILK